MSSDFSVEIPDIPGKITRKKQGSIYYVMYELDRTYYPEKKYTKVKRTMLGRVCPDNADRMFPNNNYFQYFSPAVVPEDLESTKRSCCLKAGPYLVIKKVIEHYGLKEKLEHHFGTDTGLLLDLASYFIVEEDNAGQYYPDYAYNHPLFTEEMKVLSDSTVSRFFQDVSTDQIIGFLDDWNAAQDHRQRIYLSYDATNKNCNAGDIDILEYGKAKDDKGLPIFNFAVAFDKTNKVPLFYEQYPGSITDTSQFKYFVDKVKDYGYSRIGFILDRGYFSRSNLQYLEQNHYQFLIMVKGCKKLVSSLVLNHLGSFETNVACLSSRFGIYGTTIEHKLFDEDKENKYFHLYYSASKAAAERAQIETELKRIEDALQKGIGFEFEPSALIESYVKVVLDKDGVLQGYSLKTDAISEKLKLCGYFCLISSEKMASEEALDLYKGRDVSEKLFRADKTFIGGKSMRVRSVESLSAKIFVEFIALIIRNRIYNLLKEQMKKLPQIKNQLTVPAAIKQLEKIEMIRRAPQEYKLDHAITKTQKIILQCFGISPEEAIQNTKQISKALQQGQDLQETEPEDES